LTVVHGDHYATQVVDISSCNARHVVKVYSHECSCEEWQYITAQPIRDVKMEHFVDKYYLVEKFRNAYKRLIEPLPDKSRWPKVDISSFIGAPLGKRYVGRQKKNIFKSSLAVGGSKKF
jgi:hypothetical protein